MKTPAPHATATGRRSFAGAALVISAAALWATFGPIAHKLYAFGFTPLELASIRTWIALTGAAMLAGIRRETLRIPPRHIKFFLLYGGVFATFEWLLLECLQRLPVSIAIALLYTSPAFVLLLSRVIWHEPVQPAQRAALLFSLAGVLLVTGALATLLTGMVTLPAAGIAYGFAAGLGYALFTLLGRSAVGRTTPVASLFWCFLFAALILAALAEPLRPAARHANAVPLLLALGVITTLLPYTLFLRALQSISAASASLLACIEPAFAATLAATLLGERITVPQFAGMALIVTASALLAARTAGTRTHGHDAH